MSFIPDLRGGTAKFRHQSGIINTKLSADMTSDSQRDFQNDDRLAKDAEERRRIAIELLQALSANIRLDGLKIKDLKNEGRR